MKMQGPLFIKGLPKDTWKEIFIKSSLGPGHAKRAILICYLEGQKLFGRFISMGIQLKCLLEIFSRKGGGGGGVIPVLHSQSYKFM